MVRRDLIFAGLAAALLVAYVWLGSQISPVVAPAGSSPTPTPTRPAEQTGVPRVPGTIAFTLRGDVYLLRDGRYAPITSEGRNAQPHLTADGGTLYFARQETIDGLRVSDGAVVSARLAYTSIVRKATAGGREEVVVNGLRLRRQDGFHAVSWLLGPALAADGRRLAIVEDDGDGAADLEVVTLAAGNARPAVLPLSQGADLADPAWSPDGRTIAVTTYNTDVPGILLWKADGPGVATRLDGLPEGEAYAPSYSPDGRWLLYTLRVDGKKDLHAYEIASKRDVRLTDDGKSWGAAFSPDGEWLAFLRERDGTIDLYAMELGGALSGGSPREAVKLTRGEGIDGASRPSWGR